MVTLAPLVPGGPALPTEVPPGMFKGAAPSDFAAGRPGANEFDALTDVGPPAGNHATVGDKTFAESVVDRLKNGTGLADAVKAAEDEPSLRAAVIRDAKKFSAETSPDVDAAPEIDLAAQMQRSIDILEKLKAAKASGKLSDAMVQDAIDAGVTPALIKKVTGKR
jgi:hypothetical protein